MILLPIPGRDLDLEATSTYGVPINWEKPGIYQLFISEQTYIGKAVNVRKRLIGHSHKWRDHWHRCRVLSLFDEGISAKDLHNAEAYWINLLRPQLNIVPVVFQ